METVGGDKDTDSCHSSWKCRMCTRLCPQIRAPRLRFELVHDIARVTNNFD